MRILVLSKLTIVAVAAAGAILALPHGADHSAKQAARAIPASARAAQDLVKVDDDGLATVSADQTTTSGLKASQFAELRQGVAAFDDAVRAGSTSAGLHVSDTGTSLLNFSARPAEAWNSQWVSCQWWGCTFALNHNATQMIRNVISGTPTLLLYGEISWRCAVAFPPAAWACPYLAMDILVAGKVFSWQLGNQDHGGGVYIYATYWKQWPGITSQ